MGGWDLIVETWAQGTHGFGEETLPIHRNDS